MMTKPQTFEQLLALWETPKSLSDDLGIPYVSAQVMRHRGSIGAGHWDAFIESQKGRALDLTLDDLARMRIRREHDVRAKAGAAA